MARAGLLLVNLGTPDAPRTREVRRYLKEFLLDPRVIDVPRVLRNVIVRGLILPFRPRQSAEAYAKVWTERGSPLLAHGVDLAEKMRARLADVGWPVELGMRYGAPGVRDAVASLRRGGVDDIVVFPLFPHNASSSWGSAVARVCEEVGRYWDVPSVRVVPPYYDHPAFLDAFAAVARPRLEELRDAYVLMSFHGLPERHLVRSDTGGAAHCLRAEDCCERIGEANRNCYRAQCFATARGLAERLGLGGDRWRVTFQSRLGRSPWIRPYTDEAVRELAGGGAGRVAVLCPAFVADCLETLEEIGIRAREDFIAHGGEELVLVPSLNSNDVWADAVVRILRDCGAVRGAGVE